MKLICKSPSAFFVRGTHCFGSWARRRTFCDDLSLAIAYDVDGVLLTTVVGSFVVIMRHILKAAALSCLNMTLLPVRRSVVLTMHK